MSGRNYLRARALLGACLAVLMISCTTEAQLTVIDVQIDPVLSQDGVHPGESIQAAFKIRLAKGYHVNSNKPLEDYLIPTVLSLELPDHVEVTEIVYPEAVMLPLGGLPDPLAVYEEEFIIGAALTIDPSLPPGEITIPGKLKYQACDDKACYAPTSKNTEVTLNVVPADSKVAQLNEAVFGGIPFTGEKQAYEPESSPEPDQAVATSDAGVPVEVLMEKLPEFEILATDGGYMPVDDFLAFINAAESGEKRPGLFDGRSMFAILGIVVIGGLLLNLTPCVLPMIPINLAIIGAGSKAGSRTRGFMLGGAYGVAMAAVYGLLGVIVILTAGTFGTINASPWFNLGIAVLFIALALGMFDIINIDFSRYQSKFNIAGGGKGTFMVAFGMGAIVALLAGACVAPVVIQVIVFSSDLYAKGTTIALALPFFLGLGMALPWPVAGAGLSFLPKPGKWMAYVKYAFGVFILGFAGYYGYLSYGGFSNLWVDQAAVASSVEEKLAEEGWTASLYAGLQESSAEGNLVLIDVWATWCKNCLTMDKTTLKDPEVVARLEDYVKIKFQAEDPSASPTKEIMKHFEAVGLPTYVILRPLSTAADT